MIDGDFIWVNAHPDGLYIYHGVPGMPVWIPREGSNSADETLRKNGWRRINSWCRVVYQELEVWDCFVEFDETLIDES